MLAISVLGAPSIATPRGTISPAKPFVFAAAFYLVLQHGRGVRREELAALLWPDADDAKRRERTRWLVRQLRLSGLPLAAGAPDLRLVAAADIKIDIAELPAASSATDALALAQADVLAGYDPQISDRYSHWLEGIRDTYRADTLRVLGEWLATSRRGKAWRLVEAIARRMLAMDDGRQDVAAMLREAERMQTSVSDRVSVDELGAGGLFGRAAVLERLAEGLRPSSAAGYRQGVAGPAGIGKSRLLEELARHASGRGVSVATIRCQRGDALRPLSLAVDLARALLQLPGALGASPDSIAVLRRFIGEEQLPDDGELPEVRRAAVYAAMRDLIGAVTDEAGLLVIVDDAQWAERGSWTLLAPVVGARSVSPLCWAVTIRADSREAAVQEFDAMFPRDDAESERERELFWLAPLEVVDVAYLCAARAAPRQIPESVMKVLASRSAGIPFIAQAITDHWLELGDVSSLPPSVTRLVRGRLDRLSPNATRLLNAIAVLGLDATPPAAEAVAQLSRRELVESVAALDTSAILRTVDNVLSVHALWTEAAIASTPPATVQLLHRNAAEWLERRPASQGREVSRHHWAVAMHWMEAGDHAEAQRALDSAADVLAATGFVGEAAAMLERAGDLAGVSEAALHYWRRSATLWMADFGARSSDAVFRIHARYDTVGRALDPHEFSPHHDVELSHAVAKIRVQTTVGGNEIVRPYLSCVMAEDASAWHRLRAATRILRYYGRCDVSREFADAMWHAVAAVAPTNEAEACAYEHCAVQYYTCVAGELDRATAHANRALAIVMTSTECDVNDRRIVTTGIADCYEWMGDVERSQATRRMLLDHGRKRKNPSWVSEALAGMIGTFLELGQPENARPLLKEYGRPVAAKVLHNLTDVARVIYWATCALEEGDAASARAHLTIPLEMADKAVGMQRARILSMYTHLALLEGDDVTVAALWPQLLACFVDRYNFVDHPALITARCLERFEGWEAASAFVRRFVSTHRAERWTPRAELLRYLGPPGEAPLTPPPVRTHGELTLRM
jgi:hypothetical protein